MKPADQMKVIVLSLIAVVVMVAAIAFVSIQTTKAAASHGGGHATEEHATEEHATEEHATEEHATEEHVATVSGNPENGAKVFMAKTCNACHKIASLDGAVGAVGPALDGIATLAATRKEGLDAVAYLKEAIENPGAHLVDGYPNMMPAGLNASMSADEYQDLIAYLMSLKG